MELDQNSMFLFGDGIFTTFLWDRGRIPFYEGHLKRLKESLKWLGGEFVLDQFLSELEGLDPDKSLKVRAHYFFQKGELSLKFTQTAFLPMSYDQLTSKGLMSSSEIPNFVKRPNYGIKLRERREAGLDQTQDFLWHDESQRIIGGSFSNVFFYCKEQGFFTPLIESGHLYGIGIREFSKFCMKEKKSFQEKEIAVDELSRFSGAFFITSVSGITPLARIDQNNFPDSKALALELENSWELYKEANSAKF